ncbi:hypothetical protein CTAYLR_004259 [Chrysophaeum taylorii]|uniref:MsrB domain-containing protein n=1 Tax=Chrysophaeum taylorii TaxID=2483200 RepID=A0AAD7XLV8_9STRA|nr:hypothetical protein CTAYLR_004259 [Chrysophaeum taylorii]
MLIVLLLGVAAGVSPQRIVTRKEVLLATTTTTVARPAGAKSRDDVAYEVRKSDKEWRESLTPLQYYVLRGGGTERPFSSPLVGEKREGVFACAGCGAALFSSSDKFESGTGWPSFASASANVEVEKVALEGLTGAELRFSI